jgi:hypothetical protein
LVEYRVQLSNSIFEHPFGSHEKFFEKLSRLLLIINELNPGIVVDWTYKENLDNNAMVFEKVFFVI